MNRKTLTGLFAESLFQIPDYQRGYAWEEKQWKDFIQDIDALVDDKVSSHYTGTIVVYDAGRHAQERDYGTDRLRVVDVVDGQQRLTTACLYLSVIIRTLCNTGQSDYESKIPDYLHAGGLCKLTLNNDTNDIFYDLLKTGRANTAAQSPHEKRLVAACDRFQQHIETQLIARGDAGVAYLKDLYAAITKKLHFTFYAIEEECEIGMTFELMNSRGKGLSVLELLKNYLMHWVSRNENDPVERQALTSLINRSWKDTYTNLGACAGNEDQCLRIAWTLYCTHTPSYWVGYEGFKGDDYIPLRNFSKRSKEDTKAFIVKFTEGLAEISSHYAGILRPTKDNTPSADELRWLTKIHHTGNIANFLPLMVAVRKHRISGSISAVDHVALLKAIECFAYRVFLFEGRRSNAGQSSFYRWGAYIFNRPDALPSVIPWVQGLTRYYAPEETFIEKTAKPSNWYSARHRLKYTLFEYELHLLATEGQGKDPHLTWEQLNDSTIEHILPQTPGDESRWKKTWRQDKFEEGVHDIGNLVLTQNNASYSNFEFIRKKGKPGIGPSYSHSDIRQERKIAAYAHWTPKEFLERRSELFAWLIERWKTDTGPSAPAIEIVDDTDEDGVRDLTGATTCS
jgi:hypothetical protein